MAISEYIYDYLYVWYFFKSVIKIDPSSQNLKDLYKFKVIHIGEIYKCKISVELWTGMFLNVRKIRSYALDLFKSIKKNLLKVYRILKEASPCMAQHKNHFYHN